ncbi:gfo/Idh/MocA family oxidoreductase [Brachyspira hyodysenteriae]|uniref:Gfo/Idh/MocA family protein n=1 Tax=Brachyspira hyodysenteriae TaxID=159 RepID=UPI001ADDC043|nr:Gfo/Idh/MocA family oxidoreductase [Brachyspira hyodysenteriae]QTM08866.1 gfo/Idh/MocA family oxidoreductase [Brachyspira hyodysenteriae]
MYKVGIIGLGQIAYFIDKDPNRKIIWSHIKAYQNTKNTKITAICGDTDWNLVRQIQKDENIEKGYVDYKKMLDENDFDIVSICTPIELHYEMSKKCIETGVKAVFCEKTLSYSIEEGKSLLELSKKNNTVFAVNYILRWDNINKEIKKLIEENAIGKIYTIVGYGATALHTSASHIIDLMLYFTNSEVEYVVGEKQTDFVREVHGVDDYGGCGMIKFKSGAIGFIKAVSTSPFKYMLEMDIMGENGRIRLYNNGNSFELYQYKQVDNNEAGSGYEALTLTKQYNRDYENERMLDAVHNIIECLENGGQPISNAATALESVKIIESIKLSSDTKSKIDL